MRHQNKIFATKKRKTVGVKLQKVSDKKVNNIKEILLKEYELCFNRASSVYDLTNEIIKIYTTIYFAVVSIFGFAFQTISETLFGSNKLLPVCMLLCLIVYGYATMFMHIATWAARNHYRKRRSFLLQRLLGLSDEKTLRDNIIYYLCIPRYVKSGVLHSLSLYLWYFLYIVLCNWVVVILIATIIFGLWTNLFWITIVLFLPFEWISAELYVLIKKHSHKIKSQKKHNMLNSNEEFDFYSIPWED